MGWGERKTSPGIVLGEALGRRFVLQAHVAATELGALEDLAAVGARAAREVVEAGVAAPGLRNHRHGHFLARGVVAVEDLVDLDVLVPAVLRLLVADAEGRWTTKIVKTVYENHVDPYAKDCKM